MCGLVGVISRRGPVREEQLRCGLSALQHRGPDGSDVAVLSGDHVGLGHTRLAVIGLNNGTQPLRNEDGRVVAVVNGEFYDFERLRSDLVRRSHRLMTDCDSELLVHLYEEHGERCLEWLRGEFAFLLWDDRRRKLFAARDRFGIKPLHYAVTAQSVLFASEAKALFAMGVEAAWDHESLFQAMSCQYVLPDRTLFANVRQVRPGQFITVDESGLHATTYWDLDFPESDVREVGWDSIPTGSGRSPNLQDEFTSELTEAVRLRLRADTPVCCHLSGGLDSSSVLALSARQGSNAPRAFSVSFEESSYDELAAAQETAAMVGAELIPVRVRQAELFDALSDAVFHSEGLAVNGHLPAKFLLHRAIHSAGFKVALTGEGADELLAGYAHLRVDLFRNDGRVGLLDQLATNNTASSGIMLAHGDSLDLSVVRQRLGFVPAFLEAKGSLGLKVRGLLSDEFLAEFASRDPYEEFLSAFNVAGQLHGRMPVHQSLYLWIKTALANYILKTLGDGTEMPHSIEGRVPFLDHRLFEFVRTLPISALIHGTTEKYLLRETMRPLIPDQIYRRQKHPFVAPPPTRFGLTDVIERVRAAFDQSPNAAVPLFDRRKVETLLNRLPRMLADEQAAFDPVFMMLLSATALGKRFGLGGCVK